MNITDYLNTSFFSVQTLLHVNCKNSNRRNRRYAEQPISKFDPRKLSSQEEGMVRRRGDHESHLRDTSYHINLQREMNRVDPRKLSPEEKIMLHNDLRSTSYHITFKRDSNKEFKTKKRFNPGKLSAKGKEMRRTENDQNGDLHGNSMAHAGSQGRRTGYTEMKQQEMCKRIMRCKDHYELLDVTKDASDSEIRRAYRELAMQLHPDKNKAKDASHAFAALVNAYEVLSDSEKRKKYDREYRSKH